MSRAWGGALSAPGLPRPSFGEPTDKRPRQFKLWADGFDLPDGRQPDQPSGWVQGRWVGDGIHFPTTGVGTYGWWPTSQCPEQPETPAPEVLAKKTPGGFVVWRRPNNAIHYQNSAPHPTELALPEFFEYPGEYEPLDFQIYALETLKNFTVEVTDFSGPAGKIPRSNFDVRRIVYNPPWRESYDRQTQETARQPRGHPGLLFGFQRPLTVLAHNTQGVWITVYIPQEAQPGQYQGAAIIKSEGKPAVRVALSLRVLPGALLPERAPAGQWHNTRLEDAPADFADMKEHGQNTIGFTGVGWGDVERMGQIMDLLAAEGFRGPVIWYDYAFPLFNSDTMGLPELTAEVVVKNLEKIAAACQKHPEWPPLIVCLTDELKWEEPQRFRRGTPPPDGVRIKQAAALLARLKQVQGARAAFISNRTRATDELAPHAAVGFAREYHLERLRKFSQLGCEIWFYNSGRDRHSPGFFSWKFSRQGVAGTVEWGGWYDGDSVMRRTEEKVACYREGQKAGECRKIVPSIFWEQIREGLQDQRYAATLEALVKKYPDLPAGKKGRALLEELDAAVGPRPFSMPPGWDGEAYERWRLKIARAILAFPAQGRVE